MVFVICCVTAVMLWSAGHPVWAIIAAIVAVIVRAAGQLHEEESQARSRRTPTSRARVPEIVEREVDVPQPYQDPMYGIDNIRSALARYSNVHGLPGQVLIMMKRSKLWVKYVLKPVFVVKKVWRLH